MADYWTTTLAQRLSRRRALAGAAALSGAALVMAACGGSDDSKPSTDSGGNTAKGSGLVAPFVDTTKQAVKGGVMQSQLTSQSVNFDPLTGATTALNHAVHVYSRLLSFKTGTVTSPPDGSIFGDAASSWEVSPDEMQVTLKLRPNNKLDARPPTNGRAIDSADVKFSFDKFAAGSPTRGDLMHSVSPYAPIDNLSTPDANTVVVKLAIPDASVLKMLAWGYFLNVVPVEADGKFDMKQEMRGSGPWMMTRFEPSVGWTYQRNPNWWRAAERPFLDGIDYALIPETATSLAQFKAKRLWLLNTPPADSVVTLKKESPDALLHGNAPLTGNAGMRVLGLSKRSTSPLLKDVRLRQAISMLLDRDAMLDVFGNVSGFAKEGIPVETAWHSHAPCSWSTIWLDPKKDKLGEASKNFKHNPDEAAKLLRAASMFGSEHEYGVWTDAQLPDQAKTVEVVSQMLQEGGHLKLKPVSGQYASFYQPKYNRSDGDYDGIASYQVFGTFPDWNMAMWGQTAPGARNDYITDWNNVPGLKEVMDKHRVERDEQKRVALAQEWQKLLGADMAYVPLPHPGGSTQFSFNWPWLSNFGVTKAWGGYTIPADEYINLWYDKSKDTRS